MLELTTSSIHHMTNHRLAINGLLREYHKRYGKYPTYPCYHAYQAIYAYKYAVEKAAKAVGGWPTIDEIAKAMTGINIPNTFRNADDQRRSQRY